MRIDNSMRSALGRVRGLGSAKEGVEHWWMQRLTAIALVPLTVWFVASIVAHAGADQAAVAAWVASPFVAVPLILLVIATFYHAALGLQVVIEDYIAHEGWRMAWLVTMKFAFIVMSVVALLSILKLWLA
jgi:succinate dehydrogenase / fumarate reductase, membrane anchor subunit